MKARQLSRIGAFSLLISLVGAVSAPGQGILKNNGTFTNTGTSTFKEVQNHKSGTGGTIVNSGSLSTTTSGGGSGDFINQSGGANGTVRNYSGATHGTLVVSNNLDNNAAGASIDNDNAGVGVLRVAGSLTTAGTFDTDSGVVDYSGSGAQTVVSTTYGALVASGSGAKTLAGAVTVNDSARVYAASLAVGGNTMTVKGATFTLQNSGTLSASTGTVDYAGDQNQDVIATTYGNLTLSGSTAARTKTATGNVVVSAGGALTVGSNDTLSITGNLDLSGVGVTIANSEAVKMGGDATFVGTITDAGSFYYYGSAAQSIGAVTYSDLRLGNSGDKNFAAGTVAVTGNYTIDGGTGARDYTTNSNTFSFAGTSGTQSISGLSETFHILDFSGGADKTLGGTTLGAARMDISTGSGIVTNNVTTMTLTNIASISLTVASGTQLVNNQTINMNGDLENDGAITNAGTIGVY